ncbi:long-chain fatty acid--CoA ligase [Chloroflexia bacterium SDU3-3]|nr:long-chain fatty acid--CoA ligase [Chloroflexia bacterium SDU3-3]
MRGGPLSTPVWLQHYDPQVPPTLTYPEKTLPQMLEDTARSYPHQTATHVVLAYVWNGRIGITGSLTYQQVSDYVDRLAGALYDLGVRKGDRVALVLPNMPQFVIAFFAALKLGALVVNNNPQYTAPELRHQLRDSGAETVIILNLFWPSLEPILGETGVKRVIMTYAYDLLPAPMRQLVRIQQRRSPEWADAPRDQPNLHFFTQLLRSRRPAPPPVAISPDETALLQYTGGTTGTPKAAMLSHRNLISNAVQAITWIDVLQPGKETFLLAIPFFHVYGMTTGLICGILSGSKLVLIPNPRPITLVMESIQRQKATIMPGVPALYLAIVNHPKVRSYQLGSITGCISGSAPLPVTLQQQFEQITGGRLVEGFGLTEAAPVTHCTPLYGTRKAGSIGLPFPDTEAKIIDPNTGEALPFDGQSRGELVVRGPQVMQGYWNNRNETELTLGADGWLHTGDVCTVDEDGFFFVVDRMKDIIKASGFQVLPREVEDVLYEHPAVLQCCVVGIPHPTRGDDTVTAYIVLRPGASATAEELRELCASKLIKYKVPRTFIFRSALPQSSVGKILRRQLLEEALRERSSGQGMVS